MGWGRRKGVPTGVRDLRSRSQAQGQRGHLVSRTGLGLGLGDQGANSKKPGGHTSGQSQKQPGSAGCAAGCAGTSHVLAAAPRSARCTVQEIQLHFRAVVRIGMCVKRLTYSRCLINGFH